MTPCKRRRDLRIGEQGLRLVLTGLRDGELLPCRGEGRLRRRDLRLGHAVASIGLVNVLLRHEIRPRLQHARQPGGAEVRHLVHRFRTLEIRLRAVDLLLRALDARFVLLHFVLQLRNLENREELAGLHAIADVDVDRLQIARDFRVHVDLLKWPECGGDRQRLCDVATRHSGDRDGRERLGHAEPSAWGREHAPIARAAIAAAPAATQEARESVHPSCLTTCLKSSSEKSGDWHSVDDTLLLLQHARRDARECRPRWPVGS